jgi:copper resistance protein C
VNPSPTLMLGALAALAVALPALPMHAHLTHAEPGVDSTISTAPTRIRLWFNEPPEAPLSAATLLKADNSPVAVIKLGATDDSLSVAGPIPVTLAPGNYTVLWRTGSRDGHAVRGRYGFSYVPAGGAKP